MKNSTVDLAGKILTNLCGLFFFSVYLSALWKYYYKIYFHKLPLIHGLNACCLSQNMSLVLSSLTLRGMAELMQEKKALRRGEYMLEPVCCRCGVEGHTKQKQGWVHLAQKEEDPFVWPDAWTEGLWNPSVQSAGPYTAVTFSCYSCCSILLLEQVLLASPFLG